MQLVLSAEIGPFLQNLNALSEHNLVLGNFRPKTAKFVTLKALIEVCEKVKD